MIASAVCTTRNPVLLSWSHTSTVRTDHHSVVSTANAPTSRSAAGPNPSRRWRQA